MDHIHTNTDSEPAVRARTSTPKQTPIENDCSRETLLNYTTPAFNVSKIRRVLTAKPDYRVRWNTLKEWHDFPSDVLRYWDQVDQGDKDALVINTFWSKYWYSHAPEGMNASSERGIRDLLQIYTNFHWHHAAANGKTHAPSPSDSHSKIYQFYHELHLAGTPDFVMVSEDVRASALILVKTPWQLTPQRVNELLDAAADPANPQISDEQFHYTRLAVEQIYGYMVRNAKRVGILTTMKGWSFLWREDGGKLHMTRLFGDFPTSTSVSENYVNHWTASGIASKGAVAEGYAPTIDFTIMKALYYVSYLAHKTDDLPETPANGVPGQVFLPMSTKIAKVMKASHAPSTSPIAAAHVSERTRYRTGKHPFGRTYHVVDGYDKDANCVQFQTKIDCRSLQFEPWKKVNYLGWKTWKAIATSTGIQVVLKLWDDWRQYGADNKLSGKELRDDEVTMYLHLKPIWGKYIPSLLASSPLEFFHALIIEYIPDVVRLSKENITDEIEAKVLEAFSAIHALGVMHNDVRGDNILIGDGGSRVWIIDFEGSSLLADYEDSDYGAPEEIDCVKRMFSAIKNGERW